jgi:hypothetical protein
MGLVTSLTVIMRHNSATSLEQIVDQLQDVASRMKAVVQLLLDRIQSIQDSKFNALILIVGPQHLTQISREHQIGLDILIN